MKKLIIISAASMLFYATSQICGCGCKANGTNTTIKEIISFYDVPLVCPAAPQIGYGGKSKPVLLGLEKKKSCCSKKN